MAGHEWRKDIPERGTDHTKDVKGRGPATWDLHAGISRLVTGAWLIRNLIPPMLGTDSGRGYFYPTLEVSGWEAQEEGKKAKGLPFCSGVHPQSYLFCSIRSRRVSGSVRATSASTLK